MIKVYIASPYTKGDVAVNVKRQIDIVDELMDLGFAPFAPLYSHFQHMAHPRPYEDWIKIDLEWVKVCDCILRLSGESKGADGEVELAKELNKPVFSSLENLVNYKNAGHFKNQSIQINNVKDYIEMLDAGQLCTYYKPDNTTAMLCEHCGRSKWEHNL